MTMTITSILTLIIIFVSFNISITGDKNQQMEMNISDTKTTTKSRTFLNFNETINNREKRKIVGNPQLRWKFPIHYTIDKNLDKNIVHKALLIIENETCVRFKEITSKNPKITSLKYHKGYDCSSFLGRNSKKKWNDISIEGDFISVGGIQHETLHSLGIDHEHSRYDRDDYLDMFFKNMEKGAIDSFSKVSLYNSNTFGLSYDFGSIMHYGTSYYSKNGKDVMRPKDKLYKKTIGSVERLSFIDIKTINFLYCKNKCQNRMTCYNWGYQDPNNCFSCKCIDGYIGPHCNQLLQMTKKCGKTLLLATKKVKILQKTGKKNCIYHIKAPKNKQILLKIISSKIHPNYYEYCKYLNSLEIKYWVDKSATGARFCGIDRHIKIKSCDNYIIVHFRSTKIRNTFKLLYKST